MTLAPPRGRDAKGTITAALPTILQMPLGPPEDPDRFEDFDSCVAALKDDKNLSEADAERICGAWESDDNSDTNMTDTDEPQYRQHYQPDPAAVTVREDLEDDTMFSVRMPIASTGEVRNEGDDPLTRDELAGMARQLEDRQIGAFPAHGSDSKIASGRYSPFEKLGYWEAGEVESRDTDDTDVLVAEATMPDPETLPAATGSYREALAILKEQAMRGIALSSSIGWREDDASPGGNDLMEASIVGIPADPRTNTSQASTTLLARAAIDAGVDPEDLIDEVRNAVMGPAESADNEMSDQSNPSDEQSEDTTDEEPEQRDAPEWAERMLELQEQTTNTLSDLADAIREDDEDDDEEGEEDDEQESDEDEDDEDEDEDDEQSAESDEEEERDLKDAVESLRNELDDIRDGGLTADDVDTADETQAVDESDENQTPTDADLAELDDKYPF